MAEAFLTDTKEISFGECEGLMKVYRSGRIHKTQLIGN